MLKSASGRFKRKGVALFAGLVGAAGLCAVTMAIATPVAHAGCGGSYDFYCSSDDSCNAGGYESSCRKMGGGKYRGKRTCKVTTIQTPWADPCF
jgi:hypothetical protein